MNCRMLLEKESLLIDELVLTAMQIVCRDAFPRELAVRNVDLIEVCDKVKEALNDCRNSEIGKDCHV